MDEEPPNTLNEALNRYQPQEQKAYSNNPDDYNPWNPLPWVTPSKTITTTDYNSSFVTLDTIFSTEEQKVLARTLAVITDMVKTHNLTNIVFDIPHTKVITFTGNKKTEVSVPVICVEGVPQEFLTRCLEETLKTFNPKPTFDIKFDIKEKETK